ncbi:MAG TPA: D-2-hydroxyacid dehydrogenase [Steroidobacteraceae bacterium]|jgi:phosphoglycerate dehydrogenase-like enzyme
MKKIVTAVVTGLLGCASTTWGAEQDVAATLRKFNVQEDAKPVRERKDWRVPKKMVVLPGGPRGAQREEWARRFPSVQIVYTRGLAEAISQIKDADVVVGLTASPGICEPELIDKGQQLRWIMAISAGVEPCMKVPAIRERNLLITNGRGIDSAAIGEHAIALAMAMARGIDTFVNDFTKKRWVREDAARTHVETLYGKTLLVVGLGGIGNEVASRAHGLGMKVIATRNSGHTGPDYVSYVGTPDELLKLTATADVVISCVPQTKETTNLYDAKFFAAMKPTAYFVNVARAGSVVAADLIAALNTGKIAGAALDVVDPEPLPPDNPLWDAKNLIITPHMSAGTDVPSDARWVIVNENIRRYMAGEKMLSVVDLNKEY